MAPENATNGLLDKTSVHGVLVSVFDSGVLILGRSGIGKSACALELIDRGHALIADDVINLERRYGTLIGGAPAALFGTLEVRGLGIVDVRRIFGEAAALDKCEIDLCIGFADEAYQEEPERILSGVQSYSMLGVDIPRVNFIVNGSQNLRVLVETAARYMTRDGETSGREFVDRYNASLKQASGGDNARQQH